MERLKEPLGFPDKYNEDSLKEQNLVNNLNIKTNKDGNLRYADVLEHLVLLAVIREETRVFLKNRLSLEVDEESPKKEKSFLRRIITFASPKNIKKRRKRK